MVAGTCRPLATASSSATLAGGTSVAEGLSAWGRCTLCGSSNFAGRWRGGREQATPIVQAQMRGLQNGSDVGMSTVEFGWLRLRHLTSRSSNPLPVSPWRTAQSTS